MTKPIILQLGDDIKWNTDLYSTLTSKFDIRRSYSMPRDEFIESLKNKDFGEFVAIYRPFWNTGGEMGNWDAELISQLPTSCKVYASAGAGFDWVDIQELGRRGIIYCNAAAACTESVADCTIWLMLSIYRNFTWSSRAALSGSTSAWTDAHQNVAATAHNPSGQTMGIVGLGRIGQLVAEKAYTSFGMKIIYNDIHELPQSLTSNFQGNYYTDLDTMLARSDCTVLATPFAGDILLDAARIDKLKPGSKLINIARGKLVDEDALVAALQSGHLGGAGLDVHFDEPNVHPELVKMRNVELLCHNGGATVESHVGFERLGMENILHFFEKGTAITPVNLQFLSDAN